MQQKLALSFDDILLKPAAFSEVRSRKDVDTSQGLCWTELNLPIISSNMDSVYSPELSREVIRNGGISVVHRFCTIEENVRLFREGIYEGTLPWVSVGTSEEEFKRFEALYEAGAEVFVIDVALGAARHVLTQYLKMRNYLAHGEVFVVGNFATAEQINKFATECLKYGYNPPDAFKVNIGSGSSCLTRVITGVGLPSVETLQECVATGYPIIQDGGIKTSGDFCKAIALGAKAVMMGGLFARCVESGAPYVTFQNGEYLDIDTTHKIYRGSASLSSYVSQGKVDKNRSYEGDSYPVEVTRTVEDLMNQFNGGLRSCMSYLNAFSLEELRENAEFVVVSNNGMKESAAHGKK